ncbi:MAG: hypothetical protein ACTTH5_06345, partial [Wolinella sp.]
MAKISQVINTDEKTYQIAFYQGTFKNWEEKVTIDKSTDGYTEGILFEHKQNVTAYGRSKALAQALIYLARFNANGQPIPGKIMLVSQDESCVYVYPSADYPEIINDIPQYASLKASAGIEGFYEKSEPKKIAYQLGNAAAMQELVNEINSPHSFFQADISVHNVYGWSELYYKIAQQYGQKAEKRKFFEELRKPKGALKSYIKAWNGEEGEFALIMDLLNDPITQKKLGAFYTPLAYCELAHELLKKAIDRVPKGNDYVIIDRCAGTGNLEKVLSDEELSHVIINTYELKEWYVLKDRIGRRVRYIIPPIPQPPKDLPALNKDGFLSGANALSKEFIDKIHSVIEETKVAERVSIILYENPPYAETTSVEFQKKGLGKTHSDWKNSYVVKEMKKDENVKGSVLNDMSNAFIWSAFKYFLKEKTDSYVVLSPVKYWKSQHLVNKKFIDGYAFNRKHFHAPTPATIMCALWSNENDETTQELHLKAIDLDEKEACIEQGEIRVRRIYSIFSEKFYDNRSFDSDTKDGIAIGLNGLEAISKSDKQIRVDKNYNKNILGYMVTDSAGFDNPRLHCNLLVAGKYNGNGFYLRDDNFLEKLPMFAASRYADHNNDWRIMSMLMRSGDKAETYHEDVRSGKLDRFLCQCLIWTCLTHYSHIRSLYGTDNRLYRNELCFDGDTLGKRTLDEFRKTYILSDNEE